MKTGSMLAPSFPGKGPTPSPPHTWNEHNADCESDPSRLLLPSGRQKQEHLCEFHPQTHTFPFSRYASRMHNWGSHFGKTRGNWHLSSLTELNHLPTCELLSPQHPFLSYEETTGSIIHFFFFFFGIRMTWCNNSFELFTRLCILCHAFRY